MFLEIIEIINNTPEYLGLITTSYRQELKTKQINILMEELKRAIAIGNDIKHLGFSLGYNSFDKNYYLAKDGINILYSHDDEIKYVTDQIQTTEDREKFLECLERVNNNPAYLGFIKALYGRELEPYKIIKLIKELKIAIKIGNDIKHLGFSLGYKNSDRRYYLAKDGINTYLLFYSHDYNKITYDTDQIQTKEGKIKLLKCLEIVNNNPEYLGLIRINPEYLGFIRINFWQEIETKQITDLIQTLKSAITIENDIKKLIIQESNPLQQQQQQKLLQQKELEKIRKQLEEFPDFQLKDLNGNYYLVKNDEDILKKYFSYYDKIYKITYYTNYIRTTGDRKELLKVLEKINHDDYLKIIGTKNGDKFTESQIKTLINELKSAIAIGKDIKKLGFSLRYSSFYKHYYLEKDGEDILFLSVNGDKISYNEKITNTDDRKKLLEVLKIINKQDFFKKIVIGNKFPTESQIETLIKELNTVIKIRNAIQHLGFSLGYFGGDYCLSGNYYLAKNGINILFLNGDEITYCKDQIKTKEDRENFLKVLEIINNNPEYLGFIKTSYVQKLETHQIIKLILETHQIIKLINVLKRTTAIENDIKKLGFSLDYDSFFKNYYLVKDGVNILHSNDDKITYDKNKIKTKDDRANLLKVLEIINSQDVLKIIGKKDGQGLILNPNQINTFINDLKSAILIENLGFSLDNFWK